MTIVFQFGSQRRHELSPTDTQKNLAKGKLQINAQYGKREYQTVNTIRQINRKL